MAPFWFLEMDGPVLVLHQTDRLKPQADGFAVAATRATHIRRGNDAYLPRARRSGWPRMRHSVAPQVRWVAPFWFYCCRWQIEVYFRTLKSGCRIEARYFEHLGRLLNCHAVYSLVAWRIMYLCYFGRECPDLDCEVIFEPSEWKSVYMAVRRQDPPATPPKLNEMIRMIASLGGYVIRRSTHPGTQTLWLGLQRVHDFSTAWTAFGPDD
jgi:hypothetical protein